MSERDLRRKFRIEFYSAPNPRHEGRWITQTKNIPMDELAYQVLMTSDLTADPSFRFRVIEELSE